MTNIKRVGVDIAKTVFHIHAVDGRDKSVWEGKYNRKAWLQAIIKRVPNGALIGMEACASSHYWARELRGLGFVVKLIAPQFVKPYVKSNKNDRADAAAICEALGRPHMRFVAVKSILQQDIQAAHRIREALVCHRTAKANQIRGLVGEYGIVAPVGIGQLRRALPQWLEDGENGLTSDFRQLMFGMAEDLAALDERIEETTALMTRKVQSDPAAQRLMTIGGVGPIVASALLGALGDGRNFRKGRDFAASLGLTPRQHSTGGKPTLLGISKRGNSYLRKLLVHGARSVFRHAGTKEDKLSLWLMSLAKRKHANVAIVALANKIARIAWAVVHNEDTYNPSLAAGL